MGPPHSAFGFADCVLKLELLARAAEALGQPEIGAAYRARAAPPDNIPEGDWPEFEVAVATRIDQMEEELDHPGRLMRLVENPVDMLREILSLQRSTPADT